MYYKKIKQTRLKWNVRPDPETRNLKLPSSLFSNCGNAKGSVTKYT